jgi:TatD DNase family protein
MRLYDAHNHLQDDRFDGGQPGLLSEAAAAGVARMVVNGACPADWGIVESLAHESSLVLPSFGCHPWYLHECGDDWRVALEAALDRWPNAGVGEIGIDRWILEAPVSIRTRYHAEFAHLEPAPLAVQEAEFVEQLAIAASRNRAASIHCLQAFGRLLEILRATPLPRRGFLLHSYGGSVEMVPAFVELGAYFSFPGNFAAESKVRQREVFQRIPEDRILVETDAPDQLPPAGLNRHPDTRAADGRQVNHPANLSPIYHFLAELRGLPIDEFWPRVELNFHRLFGE